MGRNDGEAEVAWLAEKIAGLRIFEDEAGKMNRSLTEVGGAMLVVSQFTLFGDCRRGRRPSFIDAAPPELAERLYESFVGAVRKAGIEVGTGKQDVDWPARVLAAQDRRRAGQTAPPQGLFLVRVDYE